MELNWSTFALEIVNFVVLVWLLKHFFYRPVLDVIARRRAAIEKTLSEAKTLQSDAQALKGDYETRREKWREERESARAKLAQELSAERERSMTALRAELDAAREKARLQDAKRQEEWRHVTEQRALELAGAFAARLLSRLATPALEATLLDVALADLRSLPPERRDAIAANAASTDPRVRVSSAYPLDEPARKSIRDAIGTLTGWDVEPDFVEDKALLAGIRVSLGAWVLHANLHDELEFFVTAG